MGGVAHWGIARNYARTGLDCIDLGSWVAGISGSFVLDQLQRLWIVWGLVCIFSIQKIEKSAMAIK
jgi:hypothetical protein